MPAHALSLPGYLGRYAMQEQNENPLTSVQYGHEPRTGLNKLNCKRGNEAALFKLKKRNHNHGRWFGRCGSNTCDFWSRDDGVSSAFGIDIVYDADLSHRVGPSESLLSEVVMTSWMT